jgi:hypothetical protein
MVADEDDESPAVIWVLFLMNILSLLLSLSLSLSLSLLTVVYWTYVLKRRRTVVPLET